MVGLAAEARIAARCGWPIQVGGGTPEGATGAAERLVAGGATGLISFGLAGGLDAAMRPGMVIVPHTVFSDGQSFAVDPALASVFGGVTDHIILSGSSVAATAIEKRALWAATGAQAIDLESGGVARTASQSAIPFAVVRAICDPAERDLPPAALLAVDSKGYIGLGRVLWSVLRNPAQVPGLLALARDATLARRALLQLVRRQVDSANHPANLF